MRGYLERKIEESLERVYENSGFCSSMFLSKTELDKTDFDCAFSFAKDLYILMNFIAIYKENFGYEYAEMEKQIEEMLQSSEEQIKGWIGCLIDIKNISKKYLNKISNPPYTSGAA